MLTVSWAALCCAEAETSSGRENAALNEPFRVWRVENPLFDELLSDEPMGHARGGAIVWMHESSTVRGAVDFGLQYGMVRTVEDDCRRWKRLGLHPLVGVPGFNRGREIFKRFGVKPVYYPYQYMNDAKEDGVPLGGKFGDEKNWQPFVLDPRTTARFLRCLGADLEEFGDELFGIQLADELLVRITREVLSLSDKYGGTGEYPFIDQCAREVRENFGFGKYGIPKHDEKGAPFKWIALRKWIVQKALERAREVKKVVRGKAPEALFFSSDPTANIHPNQFCLWGDMYDVVLNQLRDNHPTPDFCRFGLIAKFVSDLCDAEFWPLPHVHQRRNVLPNCSPEETRELMSQILRNGGRGLSVYMPDQPGRFNKRKYRFYSDWLGAPARYHAEVETVNIISEMNQLKFPPADFAIFYSNDSNMAIRGWQWYSSPTYNSAYMILGPKLGGWFRFVSDEQIERGKVDLSQFKAVFIPYGPYQRKTVIEALRDYALAGGTIISGDPVVWQSFDDGDPADSFREDVFGVSVGKVIRPQPTRMVCPKGNGPFGDFSGALPIGKNFVYRIKLKTGAEIAALFEDGNPAVVVNRLGKGKSVYFAFTLFKDAVSVDARWLALFEKMSRGLGVKLNQDIWRFKIPASKYKHIETNIPEGTCLTGNCMVCRMGVPYSVKNYDTGGSYSLEPAPKAISDVTESVVSLGAGKLTNRLKAPQAGNCEKGHSKLEDWIVKWANEDAVEVTFDFQKPYRIKKVRMYYQGELPATTILVRSATADPWKAVAAEEAVTETDGADLREFAFRPAQARWVKLRVGKRTVGKTLVLAEVEVWAEENMGSEQLAPVLP